MNRDSVRVLSVDGTCVASVAPAVAAALGERVGMLLGEGGATERFADSLALVIQSCRGEAREPPERGDPFNGVRNHVVYYCDAMRRNELDPLQVWRPEGAKVREAQAMWLRSYLPEFVAHLAAWLGEKTAFGPPAAAAQITTATVYSLLHERAREASSPLFRANVPCSVLGLPSEANLSVLLPAFEQSLSVPGDVCEFGCFRGATSLKLAYLIQALGLRKTVYAFDTFEGFQITDPGGGALGVGAFSDNFDAFGELEKWGKILPLVAVKGDATVTCSVIKAPLSFVWLDLDMGVLMEPVLAAIMPYISRDTVIGIDDVGRPETPTVEPWVNDVVGRGMLREVDRFPAAFIRMYRRGG